MFFGIPQPYIIDIDGFCFEEYMHEYLSTHAYVFRYSTAIYHWYLWILFWGIYTRVLSSESATTKMKKSFKI